jgi:hypothetical protein
MYRPYLTKQTKQLLEIAHSPSCSVDVLKEIMTELSERKNDFAFRALFEVGKLLEQAQEAELQRHKVEELKRAENLRRRNQEGFFEWPSTDAPASIHGFTGDVFFYKDGLLSYVGYRVGRQQGAPKHIRLQILDCVFHNNLPRVISPEYMDEWDAPKTAARLHKLAEAIAAFTRNAKRRPDGDFLDAIADWESDLDYLFHKYYVSRFRFTWPDE